MRTHQSAATLRPLSGRIGNTAHWKNLNPGRFMWTLANLAKYFCRTVSHLMGPGLICGKKAQFTKTPHHNPQDKWCHSLQDILGCFYVHGMTVQNSFG